MRRTITWMFETRQAIAVTFRNLQFQFSTLLIVLLAWTPIWADELQEPSGNLVLVTLDGVRWQEVFRGVDLGLIEDERFTEKPDFSKNTYWRDDVVQRRKQLFPFLWSVVASEGVLIGDRDRESYMEVTNGWWYSYPGYNEILTGRADQDIDSNDKNWNPNVTFLEVLNGMAEFENRVLAFASWDVFPYIINTRRSKVPVNAGFEIASPPLTEKTRWLNEISAEAPMLWSTVRLDLLTNGYVMDALESQHPRVIYISYGETDDFAHDGSYDRYIDAAYRTDRMLSKLWKWLQADEFYRDRTTMIVSTDHGRGGTPDTWRDHASPAGSIKLDMRTAPEGVSGSDAIWLAAIGPQIKASGLVQGHWKQSQIAATALSCLQLDATRIMPQADSAIQDILR